MVMTSHTQNVLTTEQWQEDLAFLQETINNDYPFLFKKVTKEEFEGKVIRLHKEMYKLEDHEIIVGLSRIVSLFKYGHTDIGFGTEPFTFRYLPVNFYHYSDGVYVQGTHKDYKSILGAKLVAIEGTSTEDALKAIYPTVPSENDQYFKAFGISYLRIPEVLHAQRVIKNLGDEVSFTFEKDGRQFKQSLKILPKGERVPVKYSLIQADENWLEARDEGDTPLYLRHFKDKIYYFEHLADQNAVYVRHSQIQHDPNEDTEAFYKRVFKYIKDNNVEKLVIDVRLNGGGNNYFNKPVIKEIIRSDQINQVGNLFVIIGRRTFSACQNLVNEMSNYTNAVFVGEPTAENINFYGDNRTVNLPNSKIPVFLSFAWWQDKPQWEDNQWMPPHIAVDMSFEEYKTNKDPVLEAALNYSEENYVLDPMTYFTDLFMKGEVEKLKSEAARMVNDKNYCFFDFEGQFNRAGYNLLGSGQVQQAIFVFQMITDLYPNSANAWDSLAEGFLKAGDKEKAKTLYQKAIALDKEGSVAKNAKEKLKELN